MDCRYFDATIETQPASTVCWSGTAALCSVGVSKQEKQVCMLEICGVERLAERLKATIETHTVGML
jgi:hypothetical protein